MDCEIASRMGGYSKRKSSKKKRPIPLVASREGSIACVPSCSPGLFSLTSLRCTPTPPKLLEPVALSVIGRPHLRFRASQPSDCLLPHPPPPPLTRGILWLPPLFPLPQLRLVAHLSSAFSRRPLLRLDLLVPPQLTTLSRLFFAFLYFNFTFVGTGQRSH